MTTPSPAPPRAVLARQLAFGFGSVVAVALTMCALLLALINDVAGLVTHMRHDESSISAGLQLATAVREQALALTRALLGPSADALERHHQARARVQAGLDTLGPRLPEDQRDQLGLLQADLRALDTLFRQRLRLTARAEAAASAALLDRGLRGLTDRAAARADRLAHAVAHRMATAHVSATRSARLALLVASLGGLLMLALALGSALRLRATVLRPLQLLVAAARRLGSGDFATRLGDIGAGELKAVARAFDHMRDELATRERRLVQSERMAAIGQLAAGVAHEMNNPIGIIRGYLRTMHDSDPQTLREELQILDDEAAACQRIAEDLLAFARLPELQREPLELAAFLAEALRRLRELPELAGRELELLATPGRVDGDAARLRQVLANLVLNAAQASPRDSAIEVSCAPDAAGGYELSVADRGSGIAEADRARLFEPFFSRRSGGSGLGLAVCQSLIQAHGGAISAEARPGGGTLMRVRLPAAAELTP
ncbi:MAG: HAMP domain-containing protein [Proteobacteria bacterium]|nr:HAMP domain-containing protein [Pseudomonadota bacterium]